MTTIKTARVPSAQADQLDSFASGADPELRAVLSSVSNYIRQGVDLLPLTADATMTPNQAAARLGMSRGHLSKLLDRGVILFHRVGSDRRIRVTDLREFEAQRDRDRSELAERFAHEERTRRGAIGEIADML